LVTSGLPHGIRSSGHDDARSRFHLYPCPEKRSHLSAYLCPLRKSRRPLIDPRFFSGWRRRRSGIRRYLMPRRRSVVTCRLTSQTAQITFSISPAVNRKGAEKTEVASPRG